MFPLQRTDLNFVCQGERLLSENWGFPKKRVTLAFFSLLAKLKKASASWFARFVLVRAVKWHWKQWLRCVESKRVIWKWASMQIRVSFTSCFFPNAAEIFKKFIFANYLSFSRRISTCCLLLCLLNVNRLPLLCVWRLLVCIVVIAASLCQRSWAQAEIRFWAERFLIVVLFALLTRLLLFSRS